MMREIYDERQWGNGVSHHPCSVIDIAVGWIAYYVCCQRAAVYDGEERAMPILCS